MCMHAFLILRNDLYGEGAMDDYGFQLSISIIKFEAILSVVTLTMFQTVDVLVVWNSVEYIYISFLKSKLQYYI